MNNHDDIKKQLEKDAGEYFVSSYNQIRNTGFVISEQREKPDLVIIDRDSHTTIGVEITHLYYGTDEAKLLLNKTTQSIPGVMQPDELIENLNGLLAEKVKQVRKYDFQQEIFLVIRVASRIFDKADFDEVEKDITVPENIFSEIWLLPRDFHGRGWGALKRLK